MATRAKKAGAGPSRLIIRVYGVGFGDCFLLTWKYARSERHVLIDFGSNGQPATAPKDLLQEIAADIKDECGGKLHAVVLTHRHKDHIAGFTTLANGKGPGDIIRSLKPDLVVQPWTEDPKATPKAKQATETLSDHKAFIGSLTHMQQVSSGVSAEARRMRRNESSPRRAALFRGLEFLGQEGIQNRAAVENLQRMSRRHAYVSHLSASGLDKILPGVKVTVLGPPTVRESDTILKERSKDASQFWMLRANAGAASVTGTEVLFRHASTLSPLSPPPYARWIIPRLRGVRADNLLEIVRIMDDALNNTSVILLFEVGGKAFLFPGDAQIENWQYTLDKPALMRRLAGVTFYKVGHHGSRNATPKSLWKTFRNKGSATKHNRLQTVVSTMAGKYGKLAEGTEVPRASLVKALQAQTNFFTTQSMNAGELKQVYTIEL